MIANARWAYGAAQLRTESRGMHQRVDYPETDEAQRQRILVAAVDEPEIEVASPIADPFVPYSDELVAEAA